MPSTINFSQRQKTLPQGALNQATQRILKSGKITPDDRICLLQVALTDDPIHPQESAQVQQVLDRLQMGLLEVVK